LKNCFYHEETKSTKEEKKAGKKTSLFSSSFVLFVSSWLLVQKHSLTGLKAELRRELKGTRAARTKYSTRRRNRLPETRRAKVARVCRIAAVARVHIREPGVIHVRDTQDICHTEEIEHTKEQNEDELFHEILPDRQNLLPTLALIAGKA
jgi:hypothetical protein